MILVVECFCLFVMVGLVVLVLVLVGCGDILESFGGLIMGSIYLIKYVCGVLVFDVQMVKVVVEVIFVEVDWQMFIYCDDFLVLCFNVLLVQFCMELLLLMLELLCYGGELLEQSQGVFDMIVELLMNFWGFGLQVWVEKVFSVEQIVVVCCDVGY